MTTKNVVALGFTALCVIALFGVYRIKTPQRLPYETAQVSILDTVKQTRKIRIGYAIYPPYIQKDLKTGELSGYSIDVSKALAEQMGIEPVFVETTWGTCIADLKNGKFDVLSGPLFNTIQRAMEVDYVTPYAYFSSIAGIAKKGDTRFKIIKDLNKKGVRIAVVQGWVNDEYAHKYLTNATVKTFKGDSAALSIADVLAGQSDVALVDGPSVQQYIEQNPQQPVEPLFLDKPVVVSAGGFAVKKSDFPWLEFLNQATEDMRNDGTLSRLAQKYRLYSFDVVRQYTNQ